MTREHSRAADEAQIRGMVDDRANALRAKNADGVVAYHAPDYVQFSLAPPLISTGGDAKGLKEWFDTWQGPIGHEICDLSITAGDDTAFCHSLNRLSGTKTDREKVDIWFRLTLCFRKMGGEWKIAHEHTSVPFYMDGSYKAAVDLKP
jgi:ketosteroid isomerase-like protein